MSAELDDLEHTVDLALKAHHAGAPSATKCADLEQFVRIQNKIDALGALKMMAFEATQEHRVEGHSSPVGWMKSHCHHEGRDAARLRRNSRRLKGLTLAHEALGRGEITISHVEHLHRAQQLVGEEAFAYAEEVLVDAAIEQRFSDFARTLEYFVMRVQPDDAESRARQDLEDRFASSSRTFGGNGVVNAQFEPIGFTLWDAELGRCYQFLLERDRADAKDRLGRRPLDSELGRTARQRRADAMLLMAERSAAYKGEELGPSRFTLVVHGDAELVGRLIQFIRDDLAAAADDPNLPEPDLGDLEYGEKSLHELDDGTVVTVNTLLLALLTGVVRGVLFDPAGEVLRLGHEHRLFSGPQGLANRARYRRCCHPHGCDRTAPWLQNDHIVEHADGGRTDVENLQPMDSGHNVWKTNHKHDPPPANPDRGQRRLPPDTGPLPR